MNRITQETPHPCPLPKGEGRGEGKSFGMRETVLLAISGICGAVAIWGSIILLYGGFCLLGGN